MKTYKQNKKQSTGLRVNKSVEGERLEDKIERAKNNKEPIKDEAPLIYTERKDGVNPSTDIRTDRWEHAIDAIDKINGSYTAMREEKHNPKKKDGETEPIQGSKDPGKGGPTE